MEEEQLSTEIENIKNLIYTIRGKQVMLDSDVAMLYHYPTKNINKAMKRRTLLQKLENNQVKATLYVAKIDSLPGKVNNTYHGKGKMNKYFRFAVRDDQNEVLEFLAPEDFNLSGLLLSLPGEKLVLNLEVHMDDVENPTYELVQFENLTQTLENINDEIMELMDAGDL